MSNYSYSYSVVAGVLIALSHWVELIGFHMRVVGASAAMSGLGYSAHVQIATISRLGTMFAFPIIGYLIDTGSSGNFIYITLMTYGVVFVGVNILSNLLIKDYHIIFVFYFMVNKINRLNIPRKEIILTEHGKYKKGDSELRKLFWLACFSYFIITAGFFSTFIISALNPTYRATILQFGPFLTGIGTIVSASFFDPLVSLMLDKYQCKYDLVKIIINGRILGSLLLMLCFMCAWLIYV